MPDPKPTWDVATHGPPPRGHVDDYDVIDSSGRDLPPITHVPSESEPAVQADVPEPESPLGVVEGQIPSESNRDVVPPVEHTGEADASEPPPWET